jgi:tRNA (adenine22-N1)-methyltransferase
MLNERLSLAFDLYPSCRLAADIGTDHAHLPAALLQRGRCQHMVLTDRSSSALENARREIIHRRLLSRVTFCLGDGLLPLSAPCEAISITGMGGRTIRDILLSGREKLHGASLILSAHTDWPLIRSALIDIGYHSDREEPCFAAGRFYLVIRALPGVVSLTPQEIRLGTRLFDSTSPCLIPFLNRRREILLHELNGLRSAEHPDARQTAQVLSDIEFYSRKLSKAGGKQDDSPTDL